MDSIEMRDAQKFGDTTKWMVYLKENPSIYPFKMDENWGYPQDYGNLHMLRNEETKKQHVELPQRCPQYVYVV